MNTIERLKELEARATPGPWTYDSDGYASTIYESGYSMGAGFRKTDDALLITEMRNALSKLLAVVDALDEEIDMRFETNRIKYQALFAARRALDEEIPK